MKAVARLAVVTALVVAPAVGATSPAYACADLYGECIVQCVQDLVAKGTCRL